MKKIFTLFAVALAFCSTTAFADSVVVKPTVAKIHAGEAGATHYDATATSWTINQSKISNGAFADMLPKYGGSYLALVKFDASTALRRKNLTKATLKFSSKCKVSGKNSNIYVAPIKTNWEPDTRLHGTTATITIHWEPLLMLMPATSKAAREL